MKYLFVLLMFGSLPAIAETSISDLVSGKPVLNNHAETASATTPPDPAKLKADWWRYFEVKPELLNDHIETENRQLNAALQAMPEQDRAESKAHIDRIIKNLQALAELRKKAAPETPISRPIQKAYTIKQWLDIIHKKRTVQAELQSENEDLLRDRNRLNASQQRFDSMTAAYLAIPTQATGKALQGLELMAAWSQQALNFENLRLQQAAAAAQQAQMEQLIDESAAAQDRLYSSNDDLQRLKQIIKASEHELDTARENTSRLVVSSLAGTLDTDAGKAKALLFEQRIRHSSIKEAIVDAELTRNNIELELAQMLTAPVKAGFDELRNQLQKQMDHIAELSVRLDVWREEAERDQGRAGKSLAALFGTTARQSSDLITLTQQRLAEVQSTLLSLQRLDSEIHDARLVADHVKVLVIGKEGRLKSGLETVKSSSAKAWDLIWERLSSSLFKIGETPVTALGILRIVLIITLALSLSHFVRRGLLHLSERQRGSSAFLYTLGRLAHYLILIIGISIGLSSIGIDLSNFALIAGALSLGIGFGLQAIVSNFVSGLIVLFERSLRIGDFVELSSGIAGEVRAINVRSTLVTTPDMVDILVPNSEFVNGKVINWTLTDASRRIHIPFGVAYGSDKELVRKAALEVAENTVHTLKSRSGREPDVWLTSFGDSSLDFELVVWVQPRAVKKPHMVRAAYYWELETALRKYGIEIPFPQRDLHLRSGLIQPASLLDDARPLTPTERD